MTLSPLQMFSGYPVVISPLATAPATVRHCRSWRERLWSWPWRPWVATRLEVVRRPCAYLVRTSDRPQLLMHPAVWEALQQVPNSAKLDTLDAFLHVAPGAASWPGPPPSACYR